MGVADCLTQAGLVKIPQKSFKHPLPDTLQAGACIFLPFRMPIYVTAIGSHILPLQFLPAGQYGLCFGYFVSGPLLQHSHNRQATSYGAISGSP